MSRSVVYRERESDTREWEEAPRRSYTTVKRYQVPESRSTVNLGEDETKEKIVIRRERSAQPYERERDRDDINVRITERVSDRDRTRVSRDDDDFRFSERVSVVNRDSEPRRDTTIKVVDRETDWDDRRSVAKSDYRTEYKDSYRSSDNYRASDNYRSSDYRSSDVRIERDREVTRAPSPPSQVYRFQREVDRDRDWSDRRDDYEVERYVKETDYYSPPPAPQPAPIIIREDRRDPPQPIIIRESAPQPIIIREERREPRYEFIERERERTEETRETRDESRSLVRSRKEESPPSPTTVAPAPAPPPQPAPQQQQQDEDYFYERRIIERDRPPQRKREESHDRRTEIRPKDSASNYSSEDSYEYVRRERTFEGDRDHSPHHKRHLAEGALVGAVGGEILRHHRASQGKEAGGRLKSTIGGAAVGAVGAEAISRFRSRSRRRRSMSRSSSGSFDTKRTRRRRHHSDSRSRSRSRSRSGSRPRSRSRSMSRKQLVGLAGVAALGALGGYALSRKNKNETVIVNDGPGGRPPRRSRSLGRRGASPDSYMGEHTREADKHRDPEHRNRRIAQAGLASAAAAGVIERVRSKSRGGRARSKSRLRQGVPIAAAGLGGAALAGLYEKNKANKEAKRDAIIEDEMNRGRGGRSRSRSRSAGGYDDRRSLDSRDVTYGNDPVARDYSDEERPGQYRRRHPGAGASSVGSSPDNRNRRRSRSRNRMAETGAAVGAAGLAAHELGRRDDRDRPEQYQPYGDAYGRPPSPGQYEPPSGYLPPQQNAGYNGGYVPQQNYSQYFPPPPTGDNAYAYNQAYQPQEQQQQQNAYPAYNPAEWSQEAPQQTPYNQSRGLYDESEATLGAPHVNETYAGDTRHEEHAPEAGAAGGAAVGTAAGEQMRGREPNNVSAPIGSTTENAQETHNADGVNTPRARSASRVRFNLDANEAHSPEAKKKEERYSDSETNNDKKRRRRRRKHRDRDTTHERNDRNQDDNDSDGTIDLPDRFDEHGNRKSEGADGLQDLIGNLANKFLGGGDDHGHGHGHGSDRDSRSGRRRHRH